MRQALAVLLLALAACATARDDRQDVLAAVNGVLSGLARMDADAIVAHVADDATFFFPDSLSQPARVDGKAAIRDVFEQAFAKWRTSGAPSALPKLEELQTQISGDFALVTFQIRGPVISRRTFVLRRTGSAWRVVHLHASNIRL